MCCLSKDSLKPVTWKEASPYLVTALGDYVEDAKQQVKSGNERLYRIGHTYMLLRGEQLTNHDVELVVVALAGDLQEGVKAAIDFAQQHGFDSIRGHMKRRGALRFIQRKIVSNAQLNDNQHDEYEIRIGLTMGGRSKSSTSTNTQTWTTNKSSSAASGGDNSGLVLSGDENNIELNMSDYGAIESSIDLAKSAISSNERAVQEGFNLADNLTEETFKFSTRNIDTIKSIADQQSTTTKDALAIVNSIKSQELTGTNQSDNDLLKTVAIVVGIMASLATVAVALRGNHK